ncbi:uncharacterized protein LY89DRAFT_718652 [Mollisia scopiformis]|uniref:Uncharacterized protein n=1 Tax=Mollisia scopiformis TaxID=149040 RepID=A0A194X9S8_MOLSC|nr:uncharacterized protein LY89DRAFT_718652 [Mollisia scopiformis]KUJ16935.1 hypothetical protein LY89DRAFT_718652 [Mollisia scopiformis]
MDPNDISSWQETSPGIFCRPLDEPDLYYLTNVKIWESTASTIEYEPQDETEVEKWMNATLTIDKSGQTSAEFLSLDAPVPHSAIFIFPKNTEQDKLEHDIIFRSGHDVIDGMATYALLNNLIKYAAQAFSSPDINLAVSFGDEYKNLTPPFRNALGLPSPDALKFTQTELDAIRAQRIKNRSGSLGIPLRQQSSIPSKSGRAALSFTVEETKAIITACKSRNTTITPAIHSPGSTTKRKIAETRKYCRPPYNGPEYNMMICHTNSTSVLVVHLTIPSDSAPHTAQSPHEFQDVLEQVQHFYHKNAKEVNLLDGARCFAARTLEWPTSAQLPELGIPSVSLSRRGVTDQYIQARHGRLEVVDPWAVGTELSAGLGVSVATCQGAMCLRAAYNEAYHEEVGVLGFLEIVKRVVLEGLGVV